MAKPRNHRPKIILVSNSLSTSNRKGLPAVREVAEHHSGLVHLEGANLAQLYRQLDAYHGHTPELLILNGGDGTIHAALTYILNRQIFKKIPPVAVLAGGMTNMVAYDLGTGGPAARRLNEILDRWQYGDLASALTTRNLVRVDVPGWKVPQFGFFFDAALVVNGIRMCREELYPNGITGLPSQVIALAAHAWAVLLGAKPGSRGYTPPMTVRCGSGRVVEGRFGLISTTTLHRLLYGARTRTVSDRLPLFTMRPSFSLFLKSYWNGLRGFIEKTEIEGVTFGLEKSFSIEGAPAFIMEGEIFTPPTRKAFTVSCAPPLTFVGFSKQ